MMQKPSDKKNEKSLHIDMFTYMYIQLSVGNYLCEIESLPHCFQIM